MQSEARQTSLLSFFGSTSANSISPNASADRKKNSTGFTGKRCSSSPRSKDTHSAETLERLFISSTDGERLSPSEEQVYPCSVNNIKIILVTRKNGNVTTRGKFKRNFVVESDSDLDEDDCKISRIQESSHLECSELHDEREDLQLQDGDLGGLESLPGEACNTSGNDTAEKIASFSFQSNADTSMHDTMNSSVMSEYNTSMKSFSTAEEDMMHKYSDNGDSTPAFRHLGFDFLKPDNIMDIERRRPGDPEYDGHTLYVPPSFLKSQTPGHRQWWQMKAANFDTILFFKVGKFYELYHMDAVVAAKCLNLTYMKGDYAHCGFPESALNRFADRLIEKGYKVARVEQTETPEAMEKRAQKECLATKDRVVRREICRIVTRATKMYSYLEGDEETADAVYLTAICERLKEPAQGRRIGACFVNASVGQIYLSEFDDDASLSRLRTIFATFPPAQILFPRGKLSPEVMAMFKQSLVNIPREGLLPKTQFCSSSDTLRNLAKGGYFGDTNDGRVNWPQTLENMLDKSDLVGTTASFGHTLCLSSFGAIIWYLKECKIDHDVLELKKINVYQPPDISRSEPSSTIPLQKKYMIMDEITLRNLDVVRLPYTDPLYTTLFDELDLCLTAAGKRLLRFWLCNPLYDIQAILERQKAVDELIRLPEFLDYTCSRLQAIPDLERLLQKMHSLAIKAPGTDHPECRAVFFEVDKYNKRKLTDFLALIKGFDTAKSIYDAFQKIAAQVQSSLLLALLGQGSFPDIEADLRFFQTSFDHEKAANDGVIIPNKGVDRELDSVDDDIKRINTDLDEYLVFARKMLHCSGFVRFSTPRLDQLVEELTQTEAKREGVLKDIMRRLFADFCSRGEKWYKIVDSISKLDVLQSFAQYARNCPHVICKPVFSSAKTPFLRLKNSVHPCCSKMRTSGDFIPNDVQLGSDGANICKMSNSYDKRSFVFTGQSTLYVELSETSTILRHCSANSFAIVDELGRGTSTHDGTAIASATLKYLAERIRCRTIFSTHYHNLVQQFNGHPLVQLGHMACAVENEGLDDPVEESVTFLYKLAPGPCPKSYGFNAAKLAGVEAEVIRNAYSASVRFSRMDALYNTVMKLVKENAEASELDLVQTLCSRLNIT
ncbi:MutS domain I protein [Trichuris suis]|nr:MutS domain I protein [Trichuris suis]